MAAPDLGIQAGDICEIAVQVVAVRAQEDLSSELVHESAIGNQVKILEFGVDPRRAKVVFTASAGIAGWISL